MVQMKPAFPSVDTLIDPLPLPSATSARGNIACVTPEVTPRSAARQTARQIQVRGKSSKYEMSKSSGTEPS